MRPTRKATSSNSRRGRRRRDGRRRRRPGDGARGTRPRPVGSVVVGAPARHRSSGDRGRAPGVLRGGGPGRDDGQLPGDDPGLRGRGPRPRRRAPGHPPQRRAGDGGTSGPRRCAGVDPSTLLVAGSVGPYGAMLADGSEYRGDYDPGPTALRDLHAPRIEALLDAGVDLLAIETIPTVREAEVLVDLVDEFGRHRVARLPVPRRRDDRRGRTDRRGGPGDGRGRRGRRGRRQLHGPDAPPAPCSRPPGTRRTCRSSPTPTAAIDGTPRRAGGSPTMDDGFEATDVASWADLGAGWLGGCCRTGPGDIEALSSAWHSRAKVGGGSAERRVRRAVRRGRPRVGRTGGSARGGASPRGSTR